MNEPMAKVEPVANLSSANETVASFLRSIAFKEEDELSQASSFDAPISTVTFEAPQVFEQKVKISHTLPMNR